MPFTFAHAAAAYPFRRTRLILSALIIGTFAPDLEFFLRFAPKGPFGHTFRGLFLFCLPVGLIVFWVFHEVVKEPLAALMPKYIRDRIDSSAYPLSLRRPLQLLLVLVSILIGAATHIFWDSFTHAGYWPSEHWPLLWYTTALPGLGPVHVYKILQYVSTVFGSLAVLLWCQYWLRHAPIQPHPAGELVPARQAQIARILIPVLAVLGAVVRAKISRAYFTGPREVEFWIGEFVVATISFAWLELIAWGLTLPPPALRDPFPQTAESD